MKHPNEVEPRQKMSKLEVMNKIHELSIEGIKLISKNEDEDADLGFEQYFLSMLELQTRPYSDAAGQMGEA